MQDRMQNPREVLKFNERVLMPKKKKDKSDYIRYAVWGIIILLILGSIVFHENLFMEIGALPLFLLIGLFFRFVIMGLGKEEIPSYMELLFFDEYLIVYRPKRYYNRRVTRKDYTLMKYNEITGIKYNKASKMFWLYGTIEGKNYKYKKDGSIESTPCYDRTVSGTLEYFSIKDTYDDDALILNTLEKYIPLKADIQQ